MSDARHQTGPMRPTPLHKMPSMTEPHWADTPDGAMAHYLSLTFEEQTALAFVIDWQRKTVQRQSAALIAELKAEYAERQKENP